VYKDLKKKEGNVIDYSIVFIALLVSFFIILVSMDITKLRSDENDIDNIGRRYLLVLETKGYLPTEEQTSLINELQGVGVTNINIVGTTTSKVGYGNDVFLKVVGNKKIKDYSVDSKLSFEKTDKEVPVNIDLKSIAKN